MARTLEAVWKRLNHELFRQIGPDRYALWIRHALPVLLEEELFTIHFATTHAKDKIESLLGAAVTQAAQRATNRNVRVQFAVDGDAFVPSVEATTSPAPKPTFASFIAGAGNRPALAAARAFVRGGPGDPRTLLIYSPSGLGRTHLLRAIHAELVRQPDPGVLFFTGDQFRRHSREACLRNRQDAFRKKCGHAAAFLFDDLHLLTGHEEAQKALSEILSTLAERGIRSALTCERHPRWLDGLHRSLRSRLLRSDVEVTLERPDLATGRAFLRAAAPAGVPDEVLEYIAAHVRSSHTDLLSCLAQLLRQPPFTAASARAAVSEFLSQWSLGLGFEDVVRAAAEDFGVTVGEIYSLGRSREAIEARQACFYLARRLLGRPFAQIGDHFGGRDHSTVHEAIRKLERTGGPAKDRLLRIERSLASRILPSGDLRSSPGSSSMVDG